MSSQIEGTAPTAVALPEVVAAVDDLAHAMDLTWARTVAEATVDLVRAPR